MTVNLPALLPWPLLLAFVGALGLGLALTPLVERAARDFGLGARGVHAGGPPRLGGIALALAALVPTAITLAFGPGLIETSEGIRAAGLLGLSLVILGLGIVDDVHGTTPAQKLWVQTTVAVATWAIGVRIERLTGIAGDPMVLAPWVSLLITSVWVVGVTNAMNLIDGLDGLAAGVALVAVVTFGAFGWLDGHGLVLLVAASLTGAICGFLVFNWKPARIVMGDSGSLFLGYVLAVVGILCTVKQYTAFAVGLPILALGLPIADTLFAIVRRVRRGSPVTEGDDGHVHHQLVRGGLSERQTVLALFGLAGILATVALAFRAAHAPLQALTIGIAALVIGIIGRFFRRGVQREESSVTLETAQELVRRRTLSRAIRDSENVDALWDNALRALLAQGVVDAELELFTKRPALYQFGRKTRRHRVVSLVIPLFGDDHSFGVLRVSRRTYLDDMLDRQREVQIHVVAEAIIDALDALGPDLRREWVVTRLPRR